MDKGDCGVDKGDYGTEKGDCGMDKGDYGTEKGDCGMDKGDYGTDKGDCSMGKGDYGTDIRWIGTGAEVMERDGVLYAPCSECYRNASDRAVLFAADRAPENFAFECEIRLVRDGEAGVYFRAQGKNGLNWIAGYYFSVNAADGSVRLRNVNGGDYSETVIGSMRYPFKKGVWYKIRVEMRGDEAKVWFNNFPKETEPFPKYDLTLRHFPRGTVGLEFGEGVAEFRNVSLTELVETVDGYENCDKPGDGAGSDDKAGEGTYYRNPVVYGADPYVFYENGTYYLYFTDTQDMSLFQCYTSKDMIHWSEPKVIFNGEDGWGDNEFMSPYVFSWHGLYYLIYSSHSAPDERGMRRTQIAYASGTSPLGPFKSKTFRPLHEDADEIGGHPFIDDDGQLYLTVVRFNNANEVWGLRVNADDGIITPVPGTLRRLVVPEEDWECDFARVVEGGVIVKHKNLYYMVYAGSHYKGNYAEGYAVAENPLGPYRKYRYNPILRSTGLTRGTGAADLLKTPDGKLFIYYHQHFSPTEISPRYLCYDEMKFVETEGGEDVLVVHGPTTTPQKGPCNE